jgi:transcriptional regulator with XRE-family HTH domain
VLSIPIDIPTCGDLRNIREYLGVSQRELAVALGFTEDSGRKVIRDWEGGVRCGKPFKPTPTAWATLRYLVTVIDLYRTYTPESPTAKQIRLIIPRCLW